MDPLQKSLGFPNCCSDVLGAPEIERDDVFFVRTQILLLHGSYSCKITKLKTDVKLTELRFRPNKTLRAKRGLPVLECFKDG